MSADVNPSTSPILRPPAEPTRKAAGKLALFGAGIGLTYAAAVIVVDQAKANSVSPVYVQARNALLHYQAEKGAWPKDFELSQAEKVMPGFKLDALTDTLGKCELPGKWTFVAKTAEGWPAIVFTPAEASRGFQRTLGVVDGWIDDGQADKGDFLVRRDAALLRLSAE
jgi:hypothetical protein